MKKSITLLCTIAMLTTCVSLTSCMDEDVEESIVLSGQWYGDWGMYYQMRDPYTGRVITYNSYDTDIVFYPDYNYATHGYGYQVDWYRYGPYEKLSFRFEWSITNGIVEIYYPGYPEYNTFIRDYRLSNDYFSGYLGNSNIRFNLAKIRDYYDWSYYYGYDYHPWGWGYIKTRSTGSEEETPSTDGTIIKIGSRYAE